MGSKRRAWIVALSGATALAVAAAGLAVPVEHWSEWYYGNRFVFCGHEFEGKAVVFVIDRSGSGLATYGLTKQELARFSERAHRHMRLGVIFVDQGILRFPVDETLPPATAANLEQFRDYLRLATPGSASCPGRGLLIATDLLRVLSTTEKLLIYVGDGGGTCQGENESTYLERTLEDVAEARDEDTVIHCVATGTPGPSQLDFMRKLSEPTGGELFVVPAPITIPGPSGTTSKTP